MGQARSAEDTILALEDRVQLAEQEKEESLKLMDMLNDENEQMLISEAETENAALAAAEVANARLEKLEVEMKVGRAREERLATALQALEARQEQGSPPSPLEEVRALTAERDHLRSLLAVRGMPTPSETELQRQLNKSKTAEAETRESLRELQLEHKNTVMDLMEALELLEQERNRSANNKNVVRFNDASQAAQAMARRVMQSADMNSNGSLTAVEIDALRTSQEHEEFATWMLTNRMRRFKKHDMDKDGKIQRQELEQACELFITETHRPEEVTYYY